MEIIKNFGFEPVFFIAQIINFLILAAVFKKYLYKPVLKMLAERQQRVAQGLADAEASRVALESAENEKDKIIRTATLLAEKIVEETKKSAEDLRLALTQNAKAESDRIIKEAKAAAAAESVRAQKQAQDAALDLSRNIVQRIIGEIFTKDEKEKIMQREIRRFGKYEKS